MTKKARDDRSWTNEEIEQDSAGYLAAQKARLEDQAAEEQKEREAADRERFVAEFVASGGLRASGEARWEERKSQRAAEAAEVADEQARLQHLTTTRPGI